LKNNSYLGNKYLLTMMVAKRAKQLNQGYKPLVEMNAINNRQVALKEIQEGKVYVKGKKENSSDEGSESNTSIS
jgi:DNA-directed RNA polymerase omega subunit